MKLSKKQQEVVDLLRTGKWEIGLSSGLLSRVWMQKPHLMCGGKTVDVGFNTLCALKKKGILKQAERLPDDPYWLTRYVLVEEY